MYNTFFMTQSALALDNAVDDASYTIATLQCMVKIINDNVAHIIFMHDFSG